MASAATRTRLAPAAAGPLILSSAQLSIASHRAQHAPSPIACDSAHLLFSASCLIVLLASLFCCQRHDPAAAGCLFELRILETLQLLSPAYGRLLAPTLPPSSNRTAVHLAPIYKTVSTWLSQMERLSCRTRDGTAGGVKTSRPSPPDSCSTTAPRATLASCRTICFPISSRISQMVSQPDGNAH